LLDPLVAAPHNQSVDPPVIRLKYFGELANSFIRNHFRIVQSERIVTCIAQNELLVFRPLSNYGKKIVPKLVVVPDEYIAIDADEIIERTDRICRKSQTVRFDRDCREPSALRNCGRSRQIFTGYRVRS